VLPVSLVILTKNEGKNIARCIAPWKGVCEEILIVDNGSTDDTITIARACGARIYTTTWKGYSATKNVGNLQATHDWIISLDADEVAEPTLVQSVTDLFALTPPSNNVFAVRRKMVFDGKLMRYGSGRNEYRIRIFNRTTAQWNNHAVHEDIERKATMRPIKLKGYVLHYSYISEEDHLQKLKRYAQLSAAEMFAAGKKYGFVKQYLSPLFGFIKNLLFRLGFLDGATGFKKAQHEMLYTATKYRLLKEMNERSKK
jgi:glycosyltransferase involved in cell wall biosynthesis